MDHDQQDSVQIKKPNSLVQARVLNQLTLSRPKMEKLLFL